MSGRHVLRRTRWLWWTSGAVAAALLAVAVIVGLPYVRSDAGATRTAPCTHPVTISAPAELRATVRALATLYGEREHTSCVPVVSGASAGAGVGSASPSASPSASAAASGAGATTAAIVVTAELESAPATPATAGASPSPSVGASSGPASAPALASASASASVTLGTTPFELALPEAQAKALGWPDGLAAATLQSVLTDPGGWAAAAHPEWGNASIVMADPQGGEVAVGAYGALVSAVLGQPGQTDPLAVLAGSSTMTPAVGAVLRLGRAATTETALSGVLAQAPSAAGAASSGAMYLITGQALAAQQRSARDDGAVALQGFPLGGPRVAYVATASPSRSGQRAAATTTGFLDFLRSDAAAALLAKHGLAASDHSATGASADPDAAPLTSAQSAQLQSLWSSTHLPISTLGLVDISASMGNEFVPGQSLMTVAQQIIELAYQFATPDDYSDVWLFNTGAGGAAITRAGLARNDAAGPAGQTHEQQVLATVQAARPSGGTPLYEAISQAYPYLLQNYQPGNPNRLIIATDGVNEQSDSSITLEQLTAQLSAAVDPAKPIDVTLVGLGPSVDLDALQAIASAVHGKAIGVHTPQEAQAAVLQSVFG